MFLVYEIITKTLAYLVLSVSLSRRLQLRVRFDSYACSILLMQYSSAKVKDENNHLRILIPFHVLKTVLVS